MRRRFLGGGKASLAKHLNGRSCHAREPEEGFGCTRDAGHLGRHEASGGRHPGFLPEATCIYVAWDQD